MGPIVQSRTKSISTKSIFPQTSVHVYFYSHCKLFYGIYCSTDCKDFDIGRELDELWKQNIGLV